MTTTTKTADSLLLFHGSKAIFSNFDPAYFRTGEGVGYFTGWHLTPSLKGAVKHVDKYLRHLQGSGLIYVCLVPKRIAITDCEQTDTEYYSNTVGVELTDSDQIQIIEVLESDKLLEEEIGRPKEYYLASTKAPLKGGEMSYLRRK